MFSAHQLAAEYYPEGGGGTIILCVDKTCPTCGGKGFSGGQLQLDDKGSGVFTLSTLGRALLDHRQEGDEHSGQSDVDAQP